MTPITRSGAHHERLQPLYGRGLSRDKGNPRDGVDRGLTQPSPASVEARLALGGPVRGDEPPLARSRQKCRGATGFALDVSLYVSLVVLMLIKNCFALLMEAYLAEYVVARVFIDRQAEATRQIRDHSNIARAYVALGQAGLDEVNQLVGQEAHRFGFVDAGVLS